MPKWCTCRGTCRGLFFKKRRWCRCPIRGWSPLYIISSHYQSLSCTEESTELIPKPRLRAENMLSPSKCSLQEAMPMSCLQLGHNFKQTAVSAKRLPCCLGRGSKGRNHCVGLALITCSRSTSALKAGDYPKVHQPYEQVSAFKE